MESHASIAQHQCLICLSMFDTNEILFRRDLRPTLNPKTLTGHGICPTCDSHINEGFIALVETRDTNPGHTTVGPDVARSGNRAFVKREVFTKVFDHPCPEMPIIFVEPGVIDKIRPMTMPDIYSSEEIELLILQRESNLSRYKTDLHQLIHPGNRPVDADVRKQQLANALFLRYTIRLTRRALHALKTDGGTELPAGRS